MVIFRRLRMENPKTSEGWVTPKLVVKRRRKTTSAVRLEKIERTIDTGPEKENVKKFNPFQSKTARRQSTIGFGSIGIGINISDDSNTIWDPVKIFRIFIFVSSIFPFSRAT